MGSDCTRQKVFLRNFSVFPLCTGHHGYSLDTLTECCVDSNRVGDNCFMVTPNDFVQNCVNQRNGYLIRMRSRFFFCPTRSCVLSALLSILSFFLCFLPLFAPFLRPVFLCVFMFLFLCLFSLYLYFCHFFSLYRDYLSLFSRNFLSG